MRHQIRWHSVLRLCLPFGEDTWDFARSFLETSWYGKRMKELGEHIEKADQLAQTDLEKQRVGTWRKGVWDYMIGGRSQFLEKKQ